MLNNLISASYSVTSTDFKNSLFKNNLDMLVNLAYNSITVKNFNLEAPIEWLKYLIFFKGKFCVYNDLILDFHEVGNFNLYGESERFTLVGYNGVNFPLVEQKDVKRIYSTLTNYPLIESLKNGARLLTDCDIAIRQNLKRVQRGKLLLVDTEKTAKNVKKALTDLESGESQVVGQEGIFTQVEQLDLSEVYLCDKIYDLKTRYLNEILERIGITNASEKRERVQSVEVIGSVTNAYDNIKVVVDTLNHYLKVNNLSFYFVLNGAIQDLYLNNLDTKKEEVEEGEVEE